MGLHFFLDPYRLKRRRKVSWNCRHKYKYQSKNLAIFIKVLRRKEGPAWRRPDDILMQSFDEREWKKKQSPPLPIKEWASLFPNLLLTNSSVQDSNGAGWIIQRALKWSGWAVECHEGVCRLFLLRLLWKRLLLRLPLSLLSLLWKVMLLTSWTFQVKLRQWTDGKI